VTPKERDAMMTVARMCMKEAAPRARVIMLAQIILEVLKQANLGLGAEETAAALKSLLVTHSGSFTVAQKAMTESLMSRDLLPLGLDEALKRLS
jgi:hypothetical protein